MTDPKGGTDGPTTGLPAAREKIGVAKDLPPCPFCAEPNPYRMLGCSGYSVLCSRDDEGRPPPCGAEVGLFDTQEEADAAWRLRAGGVAPTPSPSLVEENRRLKRLLGELYAIVNGESPALLDEDSGGNSVLALDIEDALRSGERG